MRLIAIISAGNYHCSYYNHEIITSYQEAIEYYTRNINEIDFEDSVQFFSYSTETSLERILSDFDNYYTEYNECYYDLEEVQRYFDIQKPTYKDGTEIKVHDRVRIASEDVYWMYEHQCDYYEATVVSTSSFYVTIKINQIEIPKPHYMLEKYNETNT